MKPGEFHLFSSQIRKIILKMIKKPLGFSLSAAWHFAESENLIKPVEIDHVAGALAKAKAGPGLAQGARGSPNGLHPGSLFFVQTLFFVRANSGNSFFVRTKKHQYGLGHMELGMDSIFNFPFGPVHMDWAIWTTEMDSISHFPFGAVHMDCPNGKWEMTSISYFPFHESI